MNPFLKWMLKAFTGLSVFIYRSSRGRLGSRMRGYNVLLLTTTGRKTAKQRTTPLGYLRDGNSFVVIGSNAGMGRHPDWCFNLQHNPVAQIQVGEQVLNVMALILQGEHRQQIWSRVVAEMPGYADYQKRTIRQIPLVMLTPDDG